MKVKELIKKLGRADPELDVYFACPHLTGNIKEVDKVQKSFYGFFGEHVPCILLDAFSEKDINDFGEPIQHEDGL